MRVKKKVMFMVFEVPEYWDDKDLYGEPIVEDGVQQDVTECVESMLHETLIFCEKKFNKRIDGEGNLSSTLYKPKDLEKNIKWINEVGNPFESRTKKEGE